MAPQLPNTQDNLPHHQVSLTHVGVANLKTFVNVNRKNKGYRFIVNVNLTVNLKATLKGVHMSRMVESATEIFADESRKSPESLEKLADTVLETLNDRFPFEEGELEMSFDFAHEVTTPVSEKRSIEVYPIKIRTIRNGGGRTFHHVTVKSLGNTACPHALAVADGQRTHIQRAIAQLTISGVEDQIPMFEDMIEVVEKSFSSPTFSVLKTVDEAWVVTRMFENPLFVEDVCRGLLARADHQFSGNRINISASVVSEESIHKHDVVARGEILRFTDSELFGN